MLLISRSNEEGNRRQGIIVGIVSSKNNLHVCVAV